MVEVAHTVTVEVLPKECQQNTLSSQLVPPARNYMRPQFCQGHMTSSQKVYRATQKNRIAL